MTNTAMQNDNATEALLRIRLCHEKYSTSLDLSELGLERIPETVKDFRNLTSINLSENNLTKLPGFIFENPRLEYLDLSYNRLTALPEAIGDLGCLETLNLRCNELHELPEAIGKLGMLSSLDLGYNRLAALPKSVSDLARLEQCVIRGNGLHTLPENIMQLITPPKLNIFGHIERIIELTGKNGLSPSLFRTAGKDIEYITQKLCITPVQAVLFSHIVSEYDSSPVQMDEIARSLNCNKIKLMRYADDFTELENRKLIRARKDANRRWGSGQGKIMYRIPQEVTASLMRDEEYCPAEHSNLSVEDFFIAMEKLFEQCVGDKELSYDDLSDELNTLLKDNRQLGFVRQVEHYQLPDDDMIILLRFCHLYINKDQKDIDLRCLANMYDHHSDFTATERKLKFGEHALLKDGFLEHTNNNGFSDRESFRLAGKAKRELLLEIKIKPARNTKDVIKADTIQEKKLFYNEREAEQISQFASLLGAESFKEIQNRLSESGMRTGFACLFSGAPGTGKTETVYQIARQTGRDIMTVDISQTKSMWFGESEKKIKEVFSRYTDLVEASDVTPILLFNEADAVIGRRKDVSTSAVAQTENAIQNIILQEMENLKGILIATTNLTQNMDKAFERRFLYKIDFKKPDPAVRQSIWQSMIPGLSDADTKALVSRFDFSGGQIENVARKRTVEFVLSGVEPGIEKLISFCQDELLEMEQSRKIGFAA